MSIHKNVFTNDVATFVCSAHPPYLVAASFSAQHDPTYAEMVATILQFVEEVAGKYPEISYIVNNGTQNPVFARAILSVVETLNLPHRIFYGGNLINDTLRHFVDTVVAPACSMSINWDCRSSDHFLECSVCVAIRSNCVDLIPWRYYLIDENGVLITEQIEKPASGNFIHSVSLREKFQNGELKFVDNSLTFTATN